MRTEKQDVLYQEYGHDLIVVRSDAGTCMQLMMLTRYGTYEGGGGILGCLLL